MVNKCVCPVSIVFHQCCRSEPSPDLSCEFYVETQWRPSVGKVIMTLECRVYLALLQWWHELCEKCTTSTYWSQTEVSYKQPHKRWALKSLWFTIQQVWTNGTSYLWLCMYIMYLCNYWGDHHELMLCMWWWELGKFVFSHFLVLSNMFLKYIIILLWYTQLSVSVLPVTWT